MGDTNFRRHRVNAKTISYVKYHLIFTTYEKRQLFYDNEVRRYVTELIFGHCTLRKWQTERLFVDQHYIEMIVVVTPEVSGHKVFSELRRAVRAPLIEKFPSVGKRSGSLWSGTYFIQSIGSLEEHADETFDFTS